jgi:hypothetical protein
VPAFNCHFVSNDCRKVAVACRLRRQSGKNLVIEIKKSVSRRKKAYLNT